MRKIKATIQELAYRSKHYYDIKDIDDNQIKCASCGKQLYLKSGCIYSHPFVGLLQCKSCWENFRIDISNDEEKCCYICGNNIRKLYECGDKNCESTFCKTCIKRNTHQSLLHAKDDDWKCFVCEPKPLWELRAVCAVVMENLPKKRNWRNIEKIEKRILPSEKEKRAQIKRMQKNLHMICDDENSNSDFVPSIATACKKEANNKKDRLRKQRDSSSTASENDKDIRRKVKNQKSNNPMIDKTLKILLSRINLNKKQPKEIDVYRDSDEDMSLSNKVSKFKRKVISNKAMKSVNNREQFVTDSSDSKTDVDSSSESSMENEVFEKSKNFSKHVPQDKSANYRKTKELKKKVVRKRIETSESEDENLEYEKPSRNKYPVKHIKLDSSDEEQEHSKSVKRTSKHRIVDSDSSSKEFQKEKLFRKKYSSSRELKELNVDLDAKASNSKNFVSRKNKNKHKRDDDEQSDLNADLGLKKILNKCKKVCSNFQSYINEMIEQLDEEENKEKLVLTFASNTDKFMKRLCKKQEALSMSVQQLSSKKSKSYKDALKISHVSVSDDEQSSDETNASEKHQSRRKIFKSTQKRESEEVSECDSDAIFSTNETSSQKFRDKMDTKKISNLNNNDTKTDADENEMSLNETKDSDENNIASRAEMVSSPIIGTSREKYTERSSKQQSTSKNANDNTKEDNKAPDKDNKSKNSQSESSNTDMDFETIPFSVKQLRDHRYHRMEDNRTEINDSANPKKDVINESTADMFDISFDELEKTAEDEEVQKTNVVKSSNETKKQFEIESSSGDNTHKLQLQNKTNCKANVEDNNKTLIKRGKTLPLSRPDKGIDLSLNLDKPNKLAVSTRNGEKNIDDSKEVDVVEKAQEDNDDSSSVKIAETLAKKNLLEESDLSDAKDNVESTKPTKKSDTDDKEDDLTVDYSDVSTLILSNDEQICNEDIAENASEKVEVITEVKKKCNDESSANCNDKSLSRSFSEDENVKTKRATKSTDMNNDNSKTSHSLNLKNDTNDNSDTATIANSKAKKALLASSDNSGSDNSSDLSVKESQKKRKRKLRSDTDNSIPEKRRKLTRSQHRTNYKIELKKCDVFLTRLDKTVLKHYMHALKMSREYLEHKALNSLINLDNLEKSYKKRTGKVSNTSTDSDSASTKVSKDFHKKNDKQTVEMEESLMDHLKNIENDDLPVAQTDSNFDESINEVIKVDMPVSNAALLSEANRFAKQNLLNGSESEADFEADSLLLDSDDKESMKTENKKIKSSEKVEETSPKQDENDKEKSMKSKWRQDKILTQKFSDTDSEAERNKWKEKQTNLEMKQDKNCNSDSEDEEKQVKLKKRKKIRRRILDSDSDIKLTDVDSNDFTDASNTKQDSDDSMDLKKEKLKRKGHKRRDSKSSTDSLFEEKKPKPKRKRLRKMTSDSDSSDTLQTSQGTPGKSGRKNIRKVLKDKQVAEDTKQAAKEEEERKKRITERQAMYNEMYEMRLAGEEKVEKLVLDFDIKTKQELVKVHDELTKRLKPHQAEGIKFMWDACFESLERIKITPGSGCIIAHCMGLGKTLQVIALTHTLLTHEATSIKTVLVVCPLSTVLNWTNEYKTWLKDLDDDVNVYELTKFKKNMERKYQLQRWQRTGGVLIIGYNMFRNLTGTNKNIRKSMKEAILECLINPGPDLVVCDEGHLLKNEDTALSKCMRMVKTLRRIVLTGTPLQNNLIEYHCMVQFVKPNLLGTRKEFMNRFVNPITNGQFDDSTAYDVKLMKKRAHVLHKMLEGSIQRFDYSVLTPFLPPKQEYVIFVRLTDIQIKMYEYYLENFAKRQQGVGGSLFADFQALQRIWTHPIVLQLNAEKMEKINEKKFTSDSEGSLKDFIDDGSESSTESTSSSESNDDSDVQITDDKVSSSVTRSKANNNSDLEEPNALANEEAPPKETEWWLQFVESEHFEDIRISAKLLLLFGILKECEMIGDKVLVFSQSLYSLTLIERFLNMIDEKTQRNESLETLCHHTGSWSLGLDYFRLDGATSAENRSMWCRIFNRPTNTRARLFLISTRAGGLGINLTAANRVIIFDASWNPSHDVQSIFRVYRFGQKKPCYVYRFLAAGTMEEKIYNRQVTKLSLSCRVVDEQQIERHYSNHSLTELYTFERYKEKGTLNLPKDRLLAEIFLKYKDNVDNYHEHDSLLENKAEEELDEEERKQAWEEYEEEKKGKPLIPPSLMPNLLNCQNDLFMQQCSMMMNREFNVPQNINLQLDYENLQQLIRKDFPNATLEQQKMMTNRALMEMYNYWERQAVLQPMRSPVMPFKQSRVPVSPGVINSNASTFKQSRVPTSPGAINSNVPLLNHLLSPSTSGNYVNVRQPIQSIVPNPLSKPNIPNNNKKNTDDEIIEIMPSTSNTNVSNVQVAQPPAMNKNQEE